MNGIYQISNKGNIRSRYSKSGKKLLNTYHLLKPTKSKGNYLKVTIGGKNRTIHRLVAETFIHNEHKLPQVNHKNGIKTDNRVENLEWVTTQQNMEHAVRNGLKKSNGITMYNPKTEEKIYFIVRKDIEKYLNKKVSQDLITRCCNGKRKTAYGMKWSYTR